jgi:hypothetical protein
MDAIAYEHYRIILIQFYSLDNQDQGNVYDMETYV